MSCGCPKNDAKDCLRFRSGDDLRELLDAPTVNDYDNDECVCSCHERYDDDDDP